MSTFKYYTFDVRELLPDGWKSKILDVTSSESTYKVLTSSSITSREVSKDQKVPVITVGGTKVKALLPWLYKLYANDFLNIAQSISNEVVSIAEDDRYAINLNVQKGNDMRYECHVDSNPLECLLYVTEHPKGHGGELVVSNVPEAKGPDEIAKDATVVLPPNRASNTFDARKFPHFVAPLKHPDATRVVVAMNYYLPSCPESMRPTDLNKHLGIE